MSAVRTMLRRYLAAASFVACLAPAAGRAQVARIEVLSFPSTTLTDQEFLGGRRGGKPVVVAGELRIPKPGAERLPAVILVHGSGGISSYVDDWARFLNGMGVAAFILDSFTPRGVESLTDDKAPLSWLSMAVDAYRALDVLARHRRVDPARIAIMGFSIGGHVALYSSLRRFQQMHGPRDVTFAAYIAFYPPCERHYLKDDDVSARPIRIFHGAADDFVPVAACRGYVERLRRAGADVRLTEYPGAFHVFDWAAVKAPTRFPKAQTAGWCRIEEAPDGRLVNVETKQTFSWNDPCVRRGGTFGHDAAAHEEAKKAVGELIRTAFALK